MKKKYYESDYQLLVHLIYTYQKDFNSIVLSIEKNPRNQEINHSLSFSCNYNVIIKSQKEPFSKQQQYTDRYLIQNESYFASI